MIFPIFPFFLFRFLCFSLVSPQYIWSHAEFGARENPRSPWRGDFRVPSKLNSLGVQPAVGQVDGEDLVTRSSAGNLSSLKLTVAVWRSHRDERDCDTRALATHVALFRMDLRYKTRRTCSHVSCEVACSLPITRWSSLKFAARFARNGHYRRNARREAVRRTPNARDRVWSFSEAIILRVKGLSGIHYA